MRRLLITVAAIAATIFPAFAYDTPAALLKALYTPYTTANYDWDNWDESKLRSKELNALFDKDTKEANGDMGRLDFDPYIDGQDYQITDLKIGDATITGDTAKAEVTFKNFDSAEDLTFTLVKEADGWKIDDVSSSNKDYPYDLKAIMTAPLDTGDGGDAD